MTYNIKTSPFFAVETKKWRTQNGFTIKKIIVALPKVAQAMPAIY